MKPRPSAGLRRLALAAASAAGLFAATPPETPSDPVIALPPMIVAETSRPWLYVAAGDTEYLSRCTPAVTRAFVIAQLEAHQLLRVIVPAEFLAQNATPMVSVVIPLEFKPAADDAVARAMLALEEKSIQNATEKQRRRASDAPARFHFLPNQRLDDRDMTAIFTYVDERAFDGKRVIVAPDFLQLLLTRRTPMLPAWLVEGVTRLYSQASLRDDPPTLQPVTWVSEGESIGLFRNEKTRRVLLPAGELFAPDALVGPGNQHALRSSVWHDEAALFARWALDPANAPARDAFWKFVTRASQEQVTERMFVECFGFGYSDLRDRLSDYLPMAVQQPVRLLPGKLPALPRVTVTPATPGQVARLRGEWERLEIPLVRSQHPQYVARYIEQARTTLSRAVARGERDPQTMAACGLCELDAGDPLAARQWLEEAVAAHVRRPRAYHELARLRWLDLTRNASPASRFTTAQLQPVLEPLRQGIRQDPPLPEAFMLMADAWLRGADSAPAIDLAAIVDGARLFRRVPGVGYRAALLLLKHERRAEAAATLASGIEFVTDAAVRAQFEKLQTALAAPAPVR